jgi:hypothetical protein
MAHADLCIAKILDNFAKLFERTNNNERRIEESPNPVSQVVGLEAEQKNVW